MKRYDNLSRRQQAGGPPTEGRTAGFFAGVRLVPGDGTLTDTDRTNERLTITDIAIRERLGYQTTRERALKGWFGPVERIDGRLYVGRNRSRD